MSRKPDQRESKPKSLTRKRQGLPLALSRAIVGSSAEQQRADEIGDAAKQTLRSRHPPVTVENIRPRKPIQFQDKPRAAVAA